MEKINILGVKINSVTQKQALDKVSDFLNSNSQHHLVTANPEITLIAWQNDKFRNLINSASLVTADGIGLIWAAKFLKLKSSNIFTSLIQVVTSGLSLILNPNYCKDILPERVAGVDFMEKICEFTSASRAESSGEQVSKTNKKIYLLGGENGVAKKTAEVLKKKYLNINIVGAETGPIINDVAETEVLKLINNINHFKPDILFVAFGAPKQEYFINENLSKMPTVKVAMGVGGAFDFICGNTKRAPKLYRDLGLEWLHRLFSEPWRATRIFNATVRFVYNVIKFKHRIK